MKTNELASLRFETIIRAGDGGGRGSDTTAVEEDGFIGKDQRWMKVDVVVVRWWCRLVVVIGGKWV